MNGIRTDVAVSMSELKKNPTAVLRKAKNRPVAVFNHKGLAFYMLEPHLFEAMFDELADQRLCRIAASRLTETALAIEVNIDDL